MRMTIGRKLALGSGRVSLISIVIYFILVNTTRTIEEYLEEITTVEEPTSAAH